MPNICRWIENIKKKLQKKKSLKNFLYDKFKIVKKSCCGHDSDLDAFLCCYGCHWKPVG